MYPFGYGLSYTNFAYTNPKVLGTFKTGEGFDFSVDVKNMGDRDVEIFVGGSSKKIDEQSVDIDLTL